MVYSKEYDMTTPPIKIVVLQDRPAYISTYQLGVLIMFIVKMLLSFLIFTYGVGVLAADNPRVPAQDNANHVIVFQKNLPPAELEACLEAIATLAKETGNGHFDFLPQIAVGQANLSRQAVETVAQMSCVEEIQVEEKEYEAQPRTGRQNASVSCESRIRGLNEED